MSANIEGEIRRHLEALKFEYGKRNPKSKAQHEDARKSMPGGNTRSNLHFSPFPLCFASAEGARLHDLDGHSYLDFLGEYTAGIYGHSNSEILAALHEIGKQGLSFGGQTRWEGRFARLITERFPAIELVRFTNSGTEANLYAIGAARAFTGRSKIVVFEGSYHGGAMTFTIDKHPLNVPFEFLIASYNDTKSVQKLMAEHRGEVAAILVEPMLSSGGCIAGSEEFLNSLRSITRDFGSVLIFDEVVTSRLAPSGLHALFNISPDLVTLGKYLGGGLSCGAFGGQAKIMEQFDPTSNGAIAHSGTFNNNSLTMGIGYTAISKVYTKEAAQRLNAQGSVLRQSLNDVCEAARVSMQFTGIGGVMNVHFSDELIDRPSVSTRGGAIEKALFVFFLLLHDIYIAPRGMINLCIAHKAADISALQEATEAFLDTYGELIPPRRSAP